MLKSLNVITLNLLLGLSLLSIQKIQSQSEIGIEAAYGFPWAGKEISDGNITEIKMGVVETDGLNWSYGAGRTYSLVFSHSFNASIESKCTVSYFDGSTVEKTIKFLNSTSSSTFKAKAFLLSPTLNFNIGKKKLRPYAYMGLMFDLGPKILDSAKTNSSYIVSASKYVFYGGAVYGITSGIGLKFYFKENRKWYFSTEARLISASYSPRKGKLVEYTIDGADALNSLSINDKRVVYKDKYAVDPSAPENPDEPATYSRIYYPFSSIGLSLGIYYSFDFLRK